MLIAVYCRACDYRVRRLVSLNNTHRNGRMLQRSGVHRTLDKKHLEVTKVLGQTADLFYSEIEERN